MKTSLTILFKKQEAEVVALKQKLSELNETMDEMLGDGEEFGDEMAKQIGLSCRSESSEDEDDDDYGSDLSRTHSLSE